MTDGKDPSSPAKVSQRIRSGSVMIKGFGHQKGHQEIYPGKLGVAPIRRSMASKWCGIVLNPNKVGSGLSNLKILITLVVERDGVRGRGSGHFSIRINVVLALARLWPGPEAVSGVQLV
jgi:hypothetical protein